MLDNVIPLIIEYVMNINEANATEIFFSAIDNVQTRTSSTPARI